MNLLRCNTKFIRAVELLSHKYNVKGRFIRKILLLEIRILIRQFDEASLSDLNIQNKLLCVLLWRNVCKEIELIQAKALSCTDPLTGLPNRRSTNSILDKSIKKVIRSRHKKSKKPKLLYLMTIDIDHFKNFNDTYGHEVGDRVLVLVAKTLNSLTRVEDHCGRYGGEEFIMSVMLDPCDNTNIATIAKRILSNISSLNLHKKGIDDKITVSIGVSAYADGDTPEDLKSRSDKALYQAKKNGRNCFVFYDKG
ncbi:MAG: GGDEF domain-containing protein [Candidatus Paceibacterota bacterium]